MKRKYVYGLLALPILVFGVYLVTLPSVTRATFITEFKHRTAALFGFEKKPSEGPQGLRSERPEEYGLPPEVSTDEEAGSNLAVSVDE